MSLELFFSLIVGIFGAFFGSFANVVIYRLKNGGDICVDRSKCPQCQHVLSVFDLVPVLSWLFLEGKCRYCQKPISVQYPLVETLFGVSWFWWIQTTGVPEIFTDYFYFVFTLYLISSLIIITVYDILYLEIPDQVSFPLIGISSLMIFLPQTPSLVSALGGCFLVYTFFYLQIFIPGTIYAIAQKKQFLIKNLFLDYFIFPCWLFCSLFFSQKKLNKIKIFQEKSDDNLPAWIGGGDLRLAFIMGFVLGTKGTIMALFLAYIIGAIGGIFIVIVKGKKNNVLPFGPFLSLGTYLSLLYGLYLWEWYVQLIF